MINVKCKKKNPGARKRPRLSQGGNIQVKAGTEDRLGGSYLPYAAK